MKLIACLIFTIIGIILVVALILYTINSPKESDDAPGNGNETNDIDALILRNRYIYSPKAA